MAGKYRLTPEHEKQLKPWADKWIANAMSTKPMDDEDRSAMLIAVRGLYEAAGLTPPPDHRIVFVPSPLVARLAGGFAAAIWWLRKSGGVGSQDATDDATLDATDEATDAATRAATLAATLRATYEATYAATYAATSEATYAATSEATDDATLEATSEATDDATLEATLEATYEATLEATYEATDDATYAATYEATDEATYAATSEATDDATYAATSEATDDATLEATLEATDDATLEATYEATYEATDEATDEATRDATDDATYAATDAATSEATYAATSEATYEATSESTIPIHHLRRWYVCEDVGEIARRILGAHAGFGLKCSQYSWRMWQSGNQWSGWTGFLAFFRHVAKIDIDYSKWAHWEAATIHGGPRIMHSEFCIVSDRPEILTVDEQNRPHNDTGPFCRWRDGFALYAHHGVRVPAWIVEHPERITAKDVLDEPNAEVRRVMIEKIGMERLLLDANATVLDADTVTTRTSVFTTVDGLRNWIETNGIDAYLTDPPTREIDQDRTLYRLNVVNDEPIVAVAVTCPSTDRRYVLRVPPATRTCAEAVAWTFAVGTSTFMPELET